MEELFDITLKTRKTLQEHLLNTPKDDLFKTPKGFNNNIWWNIAHVVVTQQLLVYKLSGESMNIPDEIIEKYRKGTFPGSIPSDEEMDLVADWLFSLLQQTAEDFKKGTFKDFKPYMTSAKIELKSVEDAIVYNTYHEGIHLGAILALKRALSVEA
ncbi:MAG: DinB family protein [Allomuricauda sp.]